MQWGVIVSSSPGTHRTAARCQRFAPVAAAAGLRGAGGSPGRAHQVDHVELVLLQGKRSHCEGCAGHAVRTSAAAELGHLPQNLSPALAQPFTSKKRLSAEGECTIWGFYIFSTPGKRSKHAVIAEWRNDHFVYKGAWGKQCCKAGSCNLLFQYKNI